MKDDFDQLLAEAHALGKATLREPIAGTPEVFGSAAFFEAATEALIASTRENRELGGACHFVQKDGALILVGLAQRSQGQASHVAVQAAWGSVLWHTHPGMRFSLAAFSTPDIEGARETQRPLLVIGYKTASPDALGLTAANELVRGGNNPLTDRLLRMGVAAQVCWPNGHIGPVKRYSTTPLQGALDEASFRVDSALGAASRAIAPSSLGALSMKLSEKLSSALGKATQRARKGSGKG